MSSKFLSREWVKIVFFGDLFYLQQLDREVACSSVQIGIERLNFVEIVKMAGNYLRYCQSLKNRTFYFLQIVKIAGEKIDVQCSIEKKHSSQVRVSS